MQVVPLVAAGAMAFGAFLVFVALLVLFRRLTFARRATSLDGTVISCERETTEGGGWVYSPTVRYQGLDGRVVEYTPTVSTSALNYAVGERVAVLVDPQSPSSVMIGRPGSARVWIVPLAFALAGLVFGGVGALMFVIASGLGEKLLRSLG